MILQSHRSPSLVVSSALALVFALGCSERVVGGGEDEAPALPDLPADQVEAIESCLPTLYPMGFEGETCPAFTLIELELAPPDVCQGCFCAQRCNTDEDCPTVDPDSAHSRCDWRGWCLLDCSEGEPCPEGMRCMNDTMWEIPLCHWVITEADEEACEYYRG